MLSIYLSLYVDIYYIYILLSCNVNGVFEWIYLFILIIFWSHYFGSFFCATNFTILSHNVLHHSP